MTEKKIKQLKCKECERPFEAKAIHVCDFCFGPLEVDYNYEAIAKRIAEKLLPEVHSDSGAGARNQSDNLAARNLYLQGRYHLNQRTEEGLHTAGGGRSRCW